MAELSTSKPVVHVSPIWPKRKERKSFKNVAKKLLKVLLFVKKAQSASPSINVITEQSNDLANETDFKNEERLEQIKGLAKLKKDGADEGKQNTWRLQRQKLRFLNYLERVSPASTSYSKDKLTRSASSTGKLKHYNTRQKKFERCMWMKSLETYQKVKEFKLKDSSNGVANAMSSKDTASTLAKRRSDQLSNALPSPLSKATELKIQLSSLDAKLDPRFQNLLRSLTPIDC